VNNYFHESAGIAAPRAMICNCFWLADDATSIIEIMSRNPKFFVDHMMVEELGLMTPDGEESPAKNGFVTFVSFLAFGVVPLIGYIVMASQSSDDVIVMVTTCG
jgi:DNA damage-binding protein 1